MWFLNSDLNAFVSKPSNNKTYFPAVNEHSLNIKRQITFHIPSASDTLRLKLTVSTCLHRVTASSSPKRFHRGCGEPPWGNLCYCDLSAPIPADCTHRPLSTCHPCCSLACSRIVPVRMCWNPGMSFPALHWESWMKHVLSVAVYAVLCSVVQSLWAPEFPKRLSNWATWMAIVFLLPIVSS